ncbi:hypothetical protein I79_004175 [Cricetulus griseus]|uniref:Uncharacterized protein n=1 Tax=Cricetulus griseus TaxID=10029 RepID=G3H1Y3_CRIGR|nr:hypothetical protein I79_004175 [Cricetulus griseus]
MFWLWNQTQSLTWCFPFSSSFSLLDPTLCSVLADLENSDRCLPASIPFESHFFRLCHRCFWEILSS